MTMLRDNKEAERQLSSHNVLGEPPEICSMRPMTGFYRDGCCKYRTRRCWQSYGLRRDDKSSCANEAALSYCSLADLKRLAIDLA